MSLGGPDVDPKLARLAAHLEDLTGLGRWLVETYVAEKYARRDPAPALARAHFGCGLDGLGPGGHEAIADWLRKLDAATDRLRRRRGEGHNAKRPPGEPAGVKSREPGSRDQGVEGVEGAIALPMAAPTVGA